MADLKVDGGVNSNTGLKSINKTKASQEENGGDIDLFSPADDEAEKVKAERVEAYLKKKSKEPAVIAKSSVVLDVKPWNEETDMKALEEAVRKIECDGLVWGASKLDPLAYGVQKLQIVCVVEDEKVSIDWLQEKICANENLVQSVDVASFQKI